MSTLRLTTISNQTGSSSVPSETVINGSAKAWITFNGTGTPSITASFNVSSITDNGVGNYTLNFTNAFTDANYAMLFGIAGGGGGGNASFVGCVVTTTQYGAPSNKTTTACQIQTNDYTATPRDFTQAYVAAFR